MRTKKGIKEKRRPAFRFERCGFVPLTFREPLRFLLTEGVFQNASLHLASVSKLHLRTRKKTKPFLNPPLEKGRRKRIMMKEKKVMIYWINGF